MAYGVHKTRKSFDMAIRIWLFYIIMQKIF